MDDEILLLDGEEAVAAIFAHTLWIARIIGLELEIRAVDANNLGQFVQRQHAVEHEGFLAGDVQFLGDQEFRNSSGMWLSTSSRMTEPRRRRFNAVSNSSTRSSASSSTSRSLSRMTRNKPCPRTI